MFNCLTDSYDHNEYQGADAQHRYCRAVVTWQLWFLGDTPETRGESRLPGRVT